MELALTYEEVARILRASDEIGTIIAYAQGREARYLDNRDNLVLYIQSAEDSQSSSDNPLQGERKK